MNRYLVLVNDENKLPDNYEDNIDIITIHNFLGEKYMVEKNTYSAFLNLSKDVWENNGIKLDLDSAYRTVKKQEEIYEKYLNKYGPEYTKKYLAAPGHSEHHTGLAIDVGIVINEKFYRTEEELLSLDHIFKIIHKKLPEYGFILRYPEGKESITKIGYEPWHFRYIHFADIANEITEKEICFEEYLKK